MTGASINFKAVKSAGHAVSHASREVAPPYLLPSDKSMGTVVLLDDKGKVSQVLEAKMALASPRAKVDKRYSPVWEGILNLRRPEIGEDAEAYRAECSAVVTDWYKRYEASTGHKVLRADIHLDEGHIDDGQVLLNAHAHIIADRTNDLGRVIKLAPKQLRELQTMTAEITQLERGKSSLKTGLKHISHHAYKHLAEKGRLETQQVKVKLDSEVKQTLTAKTEVVAEVVGLKAQIAQLKAEYAADRAVMKARGDATQANYQALKVKHEATLAELKTANQRIAKMDEYTKKLNAELDQKDALIASELVAKAEVIEALVKSGEKSEALLKTAIGHRDAAQKLTSQVAQLTDENTKLAADKARFEAMANNYQEEKARGTPPHLIEPSPAPAPSPAPVPAAFAVLTIENTATQAFKDLGRNKEAAQIVRRTSKTIEQGWDGKPFDLHDSNGETVGTFVEAARLPNPPTGAIQLVMPRSSDLVGTLRACVASLREMVKDGVEMVKDKMGKTLAQMTVTPALAPVLAALRPPAPAAPALVPAPPRQRPKVDQDKVRAILNPGPFDTGGEIRKGLEKAARDQRVHIDDVDWVRAESDAARRLVVESGYQPEYIFDRLSKLSPAQQGIDGDAERLRRECKPPAPENQPVRPNDVEPDYDRPSGP